MKSSVNHQKTKWIMAQTEKKEAHGKEEKNATRCTTKMIPRMSSPLEGSLPEAVRILLEQNRRAMSAPGTRKKRDQLLATGCKTAVGPVASGVTLGPNSRCFLTSFFGEVLKAPRGLLSQAMRRKAGRFSLFVPEQDP